MNKEADLLLKDYRIPGRKYLRLTAEHTFPSKKNPILRIFIDAQTVIKTEVRNEPARLIFPFENTGDIRFRFELNGVFKIPEDPRDLGIIVRDIDVVAPNEEKLIYGRGWYDWENGGSFRWAARKAQILIPSTILKKNRYLSFFAFTEVSDFSQTLRVDFEGKNLCEIPLIQNWNFYSVSLPNPAEFEMENVHEQPGPREVGFTLNELLPEKYKDNDPRELGIRFRNIDFHDDDLTHQDFLHFHKNILLNFHEMLEGKVKLESFPPYLGIDIYGRCNIKPPCVYCEWDWLKKAEGDNVDAVVDENTLAGYGPFFRSARNLVNCSIGEPLIHPRLGQIAELCEKNHKILEMATNGQALNEKTIPALVGKRIVLYVSLDAACKETYSKIRNDKWDSIIPNLTLLSQERKKAGNLPHLLMVFMPMRVNRDDLEDYFSLCQKIKADTLILRPLNFIYDPHIEVERSGYRFNYEDEFLSRQELTEVFRKCDEYSKKYDVPVGNQFDFGLDKER